MRLKEIFTFLNRYLTSSIHSWCRYIYIRFHSAVLPLFSCFPFSLGLYLCRFFCHSGLSTAPVADGVCGGKNRCSKVGGADGSNSSHWDFGLCIPSDYYVFLKDTIKAHRS